MSADLSIDVDATPQLAKMSTPERLAHAARVFYQKNLDGTMREYLRAVVSPRAATGASENLSPSAINSEVDRLFEAFNKSLNR